ncbi:MAG: ATP-dependent Clp protease proteolytic subunit [Polyangiaceae bacterium]
MRRIENRTHAMEFLERHGERIEREVGHYIIPSVTEVTHRGEREWHIFSRLLKDRIVFLGTEIDDFVCNAVIAQLLFLDSEDPDKDVQLYVNSPGGVVTSGIGIYDTMQYVHCQVSTICIGQAASMGAVLLAAGQKKRRYALPNSRIMVHQPLGGARGQATDIEIQAREIKRLKETIIEILVEATGKGRDQIAKDIDRDFYLTAAEAKEYGLIDDVIPRREKAVSDAKSDTKETKSDRRDK